MDTYMSAESRRAANKVVAVLFMASAVVAVI